MAFVLIDQFKLSCFADGFFSFVSGIFHECGELFLRTDVRCVSDSIREIPYLSLANPGFILFPSHPGFVLFKLHFCKMGQL